MVKGMEKPKSWEDMVLKQTFTGIADLAFEPGFVIEVHEAKLRVSAHIAAVKVAGHPQSITHMAIAETYLSAFGL